MTVEDSACISLTAGDMIAENLHGELHSQSVTIRTLKEMLDQCKEEICRLRGLHTSDWDKHRWASLNPDDLILQIDRLTQDKSRSEQALQLLRQRFKSSLDMISSMEKKVSHAELERTNAEVIIQRKDAHNKKLTLQNVNLSKSVSDLQTSLDSMIPKSDHEHAVDELHTELAEKDTVISNLNKRLDDTSSRILKLETDLREALRVNSEMESRLNERGAEGARMREEFVLLFDRLRHTQAEAGLQATLHKQQIESLEKSHSMALTMIEKSHSTQVKKLQSELDLTSKLTRLKDSQIDQMHAKLVEMEIRIADQHVRDICIDIGVQSATELCNRGSQTDAIVTRTVNTETSKESHSTYLREDQIAVIWKHICCSSCIDAAAHTVSTLFPCGHGLCSDCVADVMQADLTRVGITCKQCANNMPITRISLNYPMIALSEYLSSILPPRDC